jgi:serine protease inhibitor
MHRLRTSAAALAATVALAGCSGDPGGPLTHLPRELSAAEAEIVRAGNDFAFGLLREHVAQDTSTNIFLSPLSASMALGMATNGALGETREEMLATLGFGGLTMGDANRGYRDLTRLLRGLDAKVEMEIANSVWTQRGYPIERAFLDTVAAYFDARAEEIDMGRVADIARVNEWVRQNTRGRIPSLLPEEPRDDIALLLNAVYFKGDWTNRFDPSRTLSASFHAQDGAVRTVRMMHAPAMPILHAQTPEYAAAELPYSRGAFAMTIVVPAPGRDLDDFVRSLDAAAWQRMVDGLREARLDVRLPRFKLEHRAVLNAPLVALGMERAFSRSMADFRGITQAEQLYISEVLQKAMVEVTEEGTVAAAATSVSMTPVSLPPSFTVDRPFVFAIRERLTGSILFVGKVGSLTAF